MSAGEYGITDMSLTVITLATPIVTLSVADSVVRFVIEDDDRRSEYIGIGFLITTCSVVLVAVLSPLLDLNVFGGLGDYKGWFILAYASNALLQLCGEAARGIGKIKLIPICAAVSSLLTFVSAVLLIGNFSLGVAGYFASVSLGPLAAVLVYCTIGELGSLSFEGAKRVLTRSDRVRYFSNICKPMLRYSLPLIPNSLFWWVGTSVNRFFLTGMIGISVSGMFAAAGKIPNLLNTVYSVFQQAWQLSVFQESKESGLEDYFSIVFRILQAAMIVLCALISFLAPWVALLLLQGEFYHSWILIPVLLIANLFSIFNAFYGTIYTTTMHTSYIMRTTIVGAIASIILTPILISSLGIFGACLASVVSQVLVFAMRAIDSKKYIDFSVGWPWLIGSLSILIVQSVVTVVQIEGWQQISLICLLTCFVLQGSRLLPAVRRKLKVK